MKTILLISLEKQLMEAFDKKDLYEAAIINSMIDMLYMQEGVLV